MMGYNKKDHYYHRAKEEGYAARSAFKLEEIDTRFSLLKGGFKILDLGCAPGSWAQYASKKIGPSGKIVGIDLESVGISLPNAIFFTADLREADPMMLALHGGVAGPFDIVLSDMAPKTTGIRITDQARSLELCELALSTALRALKPGGKFVCKLFHSGDFAAFHAELRQSFERIEVLRPQSTRKESKEVFFIAIGYKKT